MPTRHLENSDAAGSAFSFLDPVGLRLPALGTIILHGVLAKWTSVSQPVPASSCSSEMLHFRSSHWEWHPPYSQHSVITGTPSYGKDKILTQLSFHIWSQLRQNYINCPKSQDMDSGLRTGPFDSTSTADKIQHRTPKATNKNRHRVIWKTSKWHKQISQSVACFVSTGTWVLITRTHGGKGWHRYTQKVNATWKTHLKLSSGLHSTYAMCMYTHTRTHVSAQRERF